jgi:hypothetical protein
VPSVNGPPTPTVSKEILEQLIAFHVVNAPETPEGIESKAPAGSPNTVAAPPCIQQGPFPFNGQSSEFPHVVYSGR